ncbi:uncharacterized protein LOC134740905 [Cydia strobilella]|uniref:uncharacterized protein LOC134740905 n=1 Tax=Cydia strobilella TaxID=1100964 RepID=UPI00300502B0
MPVRPLSPVLAEKARLELNEDPTKLEGGIQYLKEWIAKQPHLRARTDDQWLATFLRGCKFSLERAKEKIDLNYSLRSTAPELYSINHKNPKFKEILNLGPSLVLPKSLNPTDPRVVLIRPGAYDPAKYSLTDVMSVMGIIMRIMYVEDDAFVVCGGVNIMDLQGATMAHVAQASAAMMKKMAVIGQDAAPIRMKGSHYLNLPPGFETILNIGKSFLNEKNRNRDKMPVRPLSPELQEKARVELGEDPQRLQDGIQHLKEWLAKQPHLNARTDDQWLAAFLRGSKFSLERAKEKLDLHYSVRAIAPELFRVHHRDPKFKEIIKNGTFAILPKLASPTAPRVVIMRAGHYDPNKISIVDIMSTVSVIVKILYMEDDSYMVSGAVSVMDLEGSTMAHFGQMTPSLMKKVTVTNQVCYDAAPVRIKGAHYLNTPSFFESVFNLMKTFINEKLKQRIHVHNKDYEGLYKHVPKEILPAEYGGNSGTIQEINEYWIQKVEEYGTWLDEDLQYGSDEGKRPGKPNTAEDMFGVEGSFRQLQYVSMIRELAPILAKIAKDELNENTKRTQEDVQHLKEWITKQPHLKARTDDQWLVAVLRGCKFSLERVKKKLDLYYTLRTTAPDVTLRLKPTENKFMEFLRLGTVIILPEATQKLSPRIILIRPGFYHPNTHNVADIMCILIYLVQILVVESDAATVMGTKIVVDYQGVAMAHLAQANPTLLKKIIAVSQESMPLRLKGSHHVNLPAGIDAIFQLIKGLINAKARDRFKIHKNYEELREFVPQESLPKEYGGSGGTIAEITEKWVKKMAEYKSWMQQEETLGTDESRRAGAPRTAEEMFGADGSFRKLHID